VISVLTVVHFVSPLAYPSMAGSLEKAVLICGHRGGSWEV